jgi:CRP-like cAMP-binding protein
VTLDDDVNTLALNPMLGVLEPEALRIIAFTAKTRQLEAGDILFQQDEPADGGYVVLSGSVALGQEGGGPARLAGPSALIGENALLVEMARRATAIACEPTRVLELPRSLFRRVLTEHPESAARLHQALTQDFAALGAQIERARQAGFAEE